MPSISDFLPVRRETLATIRPRVDADANPGIAPADQNFIDTTPGGFYWDLTQAVLLEVERLWDFASLEVPAVMFLTYAWGEFLDEHGENLNLPRKDEAKATGIVTFTGASGTIIAIGYEVATAQVDPEQTPVSVLTTSAGTIPVGGTIDLPVQAVDAGEAGNVAMSTLTVPQTPLDGLASTSNGDALSGGADVESDEAYRARLMLEFASVQGSGTVADYTRWLLARPGVGFVTVEPIWAGPGSVRCIIMDANNNPLSAAAVWSAQTDIDPPAAQTTLGGSGSINVATSPITVISTTNFAGAGNFYVGGQRIAYTGKTGTTFTGCTGGVGTVPAGSTVFQGGRGLGRAPIGAEVLIATGTITAVTVVGTVVPRSGYTLDGTSGTQALRSSIEQAVGEYIDNLPPGEDVILNHVESRFFEVEGVFNVTGVTLNGSAADLVIASLAVAELVRPMSGLV